MLAFRVEVDGEEAATAGADDWAVLALHVTASRSDASEQPFAHAQVSVGGLSLANGNNERHHFRWKERELHIGSRVVVTLIETSSPTPPIKRFRSDAEVRKDPFTDEEMKEMRRQDYLELRKEFGDERG